ncbi:MAG: hypothetical protein IPH51_20560 [Rubrivivax sp.]|nr:hypothetical protein [Rubrivivax sp.]
MVEVASPNLAPPRGSSVTLPLVAAAAAAAFFIGMDATVKLLGVRFDALQLTFFRFASGSLFALPLWLWFRSPLPQRGHWPAHALRGVLLLLALLGWFHALTLLPLVQAVAVGYGADLHLAAGHAGAARAAIAVDLAGAAAGGGRRGAVTVAGTAGFAVGRPQRAHRRSAGRRMFGAVLFRRGRAGPASGAA